MNPKLCEKSQNRKFAKINYAKITRYIYSRPYAKADIRDSDQQNKHYLTEILQLSPIDVLGPILLWIGVKRMNC